MSVVKDHLKRNWKKYLAVGIGGVALYYGVPPERAQEALFALLALFGL